MREKFYQKLNPDKIKVIYNPAAHGTGRSANISSTTKNKLWGDNPGKCILSVGAFKVQKNFKLLIEAFALLAEEQTSTLIILGEGPLRSELEDQIKNLGLVDRIILPGFTDDPAPWFLTADLFVLSLLACATFGLLWSYTQFNGQTGLSYLFLTLFVVSNLILFGGIYWSKFAHMFYKPGAAIQKNLAEADGSRDNLPPPADAPEQFGLGIKREEPKHY